MRQTRLILQVVITIMAVCCVGTAWCASNGKPQLLVAVAANAQAVMEELARRFERTTSVSVTQSAGSTGMLARQVREGAPFDLFVSADTATVQRLADEGFITTGTVTPYAIGRLVLWQGVTSLPRLTDLADLRSSSTAHFRIAVANPETAPYGAAAVEAMKRVGVFESVQERVVYSDNVAQALQFATSGNADCCFVPRSLTLKQDDQGLTVSQSLHDPIIQSLGVVAASKNTATAEALRSFLMGNEARDMLRGAGYELPDVVK